MIQLRLKGVLSGEVLRIAREAAVRCRAAGVLFLVNDRADVAALSGADGVHLGQEDLPVAEARAILGPGALIGLSTHSDEELDAALAAGVDYVGFGPIFATSTKARTSPGGAPLPPPHGVDGLARAARRAGRVPVVAIGGIGPDSARSLALAGAACIAAISQLCEAPDPEAATRALRAAFLAGADPSQLVTDPGTLGPQPPASSHQPSLPRVPRG